MSTSDYRDSSDHSPNTRAAIRLGLEPNSEGWKQIVSQIRENDPLAVSQLYRILSRGIRMFLMNRMPFDQAEDSLHDVLIIVIKAIQAGKIREPERVMGFVRTVVRRKEAAYVRKMVSNRTAGKEITDDCVGCDLNPEERVIHEERVEIMRRFLASLSTRDREILVRFYLKEQSKQEICESMDLTDTQFRLLKSRAKAKFSALVQRRAVQGGRELLYRRLQFDVT